MKPLYARNVSRLVLATLASLVEPTVNSPPSIPSIEGNIEGKPGDEYEYTIESTDPENDEISYYIDWGDNNSVEWTRYGSSGDPLHVPYSYYSKGIFIIRAKAKDSKGFESDWGTLEVSIPKDRLINLQFTNLLQKYSLIYSVIQKLHDL